ncbi:MAG: LPS export ABC transporter permease LptG [Pseudomonadota bacterium]
MTLLDRYIARGIFQWTLMVLVVLMSLRVFNTFIDESGELTGGGYGVLDALLVTLLRTPRFAVEVFPVAGLIGGLLALGGLARHSEITAMRTAGVSVWRVLGSVLMAGLVLSASVVLLSEVVAPVTEERAERLRAERLNQPSVLRTRYGYWFRENNDFINIRGLSVAGELSGIYIYRLTENWELDSVTHGQQAYYADDGWRLRKVSITRGAGGSVVRETHDELPWQMGLSPDMLDLVAIKPAFMSAWDLLQYLRFMWDNDQAQPEYEVAFWSKIAVPVTTLVLLMLAVIFVLGNLRQVDMGQRILTGALIGTAFFILNRAATFVALVYDISPALAAWTPTLVFLLLTLYLLRRLA